MIKYTTFNKTIDGVDVLFTDDPNRCERAEKCLLNNTLVAYGIKGNRWESVILSKELLKDHNQLINFITNTLIYRLNKYSNA